MVTLDTLLGYYFGPVRGSGSNGTRGTVTLDPCDEVPSEAKGKGGGGKVVPCKPTANAQSVLGGAVAVMNGTGAGQVRRIVAWTVPQPTITLDEPFDPPLDSSSFVTVSPYWGRIIWENTTQQDGGHFQLYGAAFDWVIRGLTQKRIGGLMGIGGGPWFEPNHRIEVVDSYVESHWGSNGFIEAGGQCGSGNCTTMRYWVLRRNRGGHGAGIGVVGEDSLMEGNHGLSCCPQPSQGCQAGAKANVATSSPTSLPYGIRSVVVRDGGPVEECAPVPSGPE